MDCQVEKGHPALDADILVVDPCLREIGKRIEDLGCQVDIQRISGFL